MPAALVLESASERLPDTPQLKILPRCAVRDCGYKESRRPGTEPRRKRPKKWHLSALGTEIVSAHRTRFHPILPAVCNSPAMIHLHEN